MCSILRIDDDRVFEVLPSSLKYKRHYETFVKKVKSGLSIPENMFTDITPPGKKMKCGYQEVEGEGIRVV